MTTASDLAALPSNLHVAWARLFVHAVAAAGVTDVVLSPGSRSAPLAIALAGEPALRLHVVLDERSAGFFALGQARVSGRPSMLVCTSGSAGAHYLPALIEASLSFVPMLVVTADRPWELYDAAAPQTIDQVKLFGGFTRHYAELGLPDASPSALRAVTRIAAQSVALAQSPTPGPVHVNARFRKPLEPVTTSGVERWEPFVEALLAQGTPAVHAPSLEIEGEVIGAVAERIAHSERGLMVCGPAPIAQGGGRAAILELARCAGFPLVAEATSQLRFGGERAGVVDGGPVDAIFRDARLAPPDLVLQLGAPPTSSAYAAFLGRANPARIVVAPHGWNDPEGTATMLLHTGPIAFAKAIRDRLTPRSPSTWTLAARRAAERAEELATRITGTAALHEAAIARILVESCPAGALLVIGNSTPVRDLDLFCPPSGRPLRVAHQRGASGIDGLVSGAAGAASEGGPTAVLLGDLSLAHDLTGLGLLSDVAAPFVVVVVQNGGGRIFEQLPVADRIDADVFERCFATPQAVRFDRAAEAFGLQYVRATTRAEFERGLASAWGRASATVVEAVAPPHGRAAMQRELWAEFALLNV